MYNIFYGNLGKYKTVIIKNEETSESSEIALQGACLLNYNVVHKDGLVNVVDGFSDEEEFTAARGARNWIMTPFANRIPDGKYKFNGKEYELKPLPPRTQVIHGFTSYHNFEIVEQSINEKVAKLVLKTEILPDQYEGYPFHISVIVEYKMENKKLTIKVTGINNGDEPAPFWSGWHPYFKTNSNSIEHFAVTINAKSIIAMDESLIPLEGKEAYVPVKGLPKHNYNGNLTIEARRLMDRKLDVCYAELVEVRGGIYESSIYDDKENIRITMFQDQGVTLAFSGDSLSKRARKSIALEPMQCLTNSFNRKEFEDKITLKPKGESTFTFGVKVRSEK